MRAGTTGKTSRRFAKKATALLVAAALAVTPLLSGCATDATIDGDEAPLASTAEMYADSAESTSVSASETLTIIAGAAVPTTTGGTTYKFPNLRVESNTTRPIMSITIQFTTAVTSTDSINMGNSGKFVLLAGGKAQNRSVNATGGATAAEWEDYLKNNLTVTLAGDGTKGLRMIASFEQTNRILDYNSLNGHYYETVKTGVTWETAFKEAQKKNYMGMRGYLVTVTSQQEHDYVYTMIGTDCWMGLTCWDIYTNPVKNKYAEFYKTQGITIPASTYSSNVSTPWYFWVDGPEAGKIATKGGLGTQVAVADPDGGTMFANWASKEPNNSGGEYCAHFFSSQGGKWNDYPNGSSCQYVIEYGGLEGEDDPAGSASVDAKVDVNVDVYVKVDIKIDPKGKTLSTEAANTTVGTTPKIYESVNGDTDIKTKVDGVEKPAEIVRTFSVKMPDGKWREMDTSELVDGYPVHAGTYKVVSTAASEINGGTAVPYAPGESQFTIKPKTLDPAKDFVDTESGKTLEELGGTGSVPGDDEGDGTGEGDGSGDGTGDAADTPWLIDDSTAVPVDPETEAPLDKAAIAADIEERYGDREGFPTGGEPVIKITRIGDEGAQETVEAIDPAVPGTYIVEATYPQPDGTEKKVRTIYTVAGPDGTIPGGGVIPTPEPKKPTLGIFNKVYDGTDSFDVSRLSFPGLEGAKVRLVAESAKYDTDGAGNRKLILTGVHLEGDDAGDYVIPGLEDGVLTLDAYIAPRELIITARSTVTFGTAHAAMIDGAGNLAELRCDEDVHDDAESPWLVNMLAPEDAEWVDDIIESILGSATFTALRDGDDLELDPTSPEAGLYTVDVHFDNVNPVGSATEPEGDEGEGGEEGAPEGDEPETTPAAFAASAARGLGLISTAYADEFAAPLQVVAIDDHHYDLGNYMLTLREGRVLVSDEPAVDTRLEELGEVVADEGTEKPYDPDGTPIDPDGIKDIVKENWGDKIPEGSEPIITITKDGEPVDAIDPKVPGTYTVVAVYPDPEGGPDKIVRYTYTVDEPEPTPEPVGSEWPGDDGWTIDEKDKPVTLDPDRGPMTKQDVADDLEDRYGDRPEFPTGGEPKVRITRNGETVDVIDPNVPGTYLVETEYTMPDGSKKYVRTSYVVPEKNNGPQGNADDGANAPSGANTGNAGNVGSGDDSFYGDAGDGKTTIVGNGSGAGSGMKGPVGTVLKLAQTGDTLALGAIAVVALLAGAAVAVAVIRMRRRNEAADSE